MSSATNAPQQQPEPLHVDNDVAKLIHTEARSRATLRGTVDHSATTELARTRWLSLQTLSYSLPHDNDSKPAPRKWDMARRATKPDRDPALRADDADAADAVAVCALLRGDASEPRVLLVKQYRPPLDAVTVELPAGLIDAGETAAQAALRELREETGYTGKVRRVHAAAALSPGLSDEVVSLVEVEVETVDAERRVQDLDENENIHVVSVPLSRLGDALEWMRRAEDVVIMHPVSMLAVGISMGAFSGNAS